MKKILTIILIFTVSVCFSAFNAIADDLQNNIKIEFCVGDDNLLINGNSVQVEKPYVTGDGVTLVPLRVISEAFGAEVEWIDETSGIKITYPDVNIHLQIGNPVAEVNEMAQTLPNAPELTNGYAMVPLRFISETFGATVTYDEETEKITVEKTDVEEGSIVEGNIANAKIGDSYYGWSMENPKDMQVSTNFNRTEINLYSDDGNYIDIYIETASDYNIKKEFENMKKSSRYAGAVLTAEMDTSDPDKQTILFCTDYEYSFYVEYIVVTDKYIYTINSTIYSDDSEIIEEYQRIISTFENAYTGDDIHDFSNVENNMRLYESDNLKFSFCVPANYSLKSYEESKNNIVFNTNDDSDTVSGIVINAYSVSDGGTAREMAINNYELSKKITNESLAEFSENVETKNYGGLEASQYCVNINTANDSFKAADIFFTIGEYTYNFSIILSDMNDEFDEHVNSIMESIDAEEIDSSEVGLLFADSCEIDETRSVEIGNCTIDLPVLYEDDYISDWSNSGIHNFMASLAKCELTVQEVKNVNRLSDLKKDIEKSKENVSDIMESVSIVLETVSDIREINIGSDKCLKYTGKMEYGYETAYIEIYALIKDSVGYEFYFIYDELSYSSYLRDMEQKIVSSLKVAE